MIFIQERDLRKTAFDRHNYFDSSTLIKTIVESIVDKNSVYYRPFFRKLRGSVFLANGSFYVKLFQGKSVRNINSFVYCSIPK